MNATTPHTVRDRNAWSDAKELDERGQGLTSWEIDWLDSVLKQLREGRELSTEQWTTLINIRRKRL